MDKVNQWRLELEIIKSILSKTPLIETTKWGSPVYMYNKKNIIGIAGFKNFFTIWFFDGYKLKDEKKVLINAQEGVTKSMRQWRFTSKDEIEVELILQYIQEAMELS